VPGFADSEKPDVDWFLAGTIDRRKFDEYLLSPVHPDGRSKLALWNDVFDIDEGDGELLERLIREQLHQATVIEREPRLDPEDESRAYRRFELNIPRFEGPNGTVENVLTAWALNPEDKVPHLVTAYPKRVPGERTVRGQG
jgi:hypothetical protein